MGHTPGPWYVSEVIELGLGLPKRKWQVYRRDGAYAHPATVHNAADAHLIAAAPELLEAAKLALKIAENWTHDQLDGTSGLALSKSTGEAE